MREVCFSDSQTLSINLDNIVRNFTVSVMTMALQRMKQKAKNVLQEADEWMGIYLSHDGNHDGRNQTFPFLHLAQA